MAVLHGPCLQVHADYERRVQAEVELRMEKEKELRDLVGCTSAFLVCSGCFHASYRLVKTLQIHGAPCAKFAAWRLDQSLCSLIWGLLGQNHVTCMLETRGRGSEGASPLCSL